MSEVVTTDFDFRGMNALLRGIQSAFIGIGHDEDADAHVLTRQHAKLLSWECSKQLGPKTQAAGKHKIELDMKKVFHPMVNSKTGADWNLFEGQKAAGSDGTRWLYGGPTYLVGIKTEDLQPEMSDGAMAAAYNAAGRGKSGRGIAWKDQGERIQGFIVKRGKYRPSHGRQHVFLLDRIAVKQQRFAAFLKKITGRVGRMRATFAYTASQLGMTGIPAWISKQFGSVAADGRAIFDDTELNHPTRPSITFGSRAPGIAAFKPKIANAVKTRTVKMREHLRMILNGYAKDANSKQGIRRRAKIISLSE